MMEWNPSGDYPQIDKTVYVHATAVIIGKVRIGKNVFVGPHAVVRADEPKSSVVIGDNCNIQDRVIIHALKESSVDIEDNISLSHGCIIHGPCKIGKGCFIGFGSVVFRADIGERVCVKHLAAVEGVDVASGRMIESCRVISCEDDTRRLAYVDKETKNFMDRVIETNLELVKGYKNE